jgi:hypothetical protein
LQPKPNKIRPKGDTKILRKLLLECRHLQKTRQLRRQTRRCLDEQQVHRQGENGTNKQREFDGEQGSYSATNSPIYITSPYTSNVHPLSLESLEHDQNAHGPALPEVEGPALSLSEDQNESYHASTAAIDLDSPTHLSSLSDSNPSAAFPEWIIQHPES